jgi:hypothetical protein
LGYVFRQAATVSAPPSSLQAIVTLMKRKPAAVCVNWKLLLWVRPNFVEHRDSGPSVILLAVKLTSGYWPAPPVASDPS